MFKKPVAVITGASSGLGEALMSEFGRRGFARVAVCRSCPRSEHELWIKADICSAEELAAACAVIEQECGGVDVLVNNAGIGSYDTWMEMPESDLRSMFELNFFAPVALSRRLLPLLERQGGTIINISSVAGNMYVPCMGAYCAGKAALSMFTDSLRAEIHNSGVKVLKVMPGRINTGFSSRAMGGRRPPETPAGGSSADIFAHKVFKAYRKGSRSIIYPRWYSLVSFIPALLPRLYDRKSREAWKI